MGRWLNMSQRTRASGPIYDACLTRIHDSVEWFPSSQVDIETDIERPVWFALDEAIREALLLEATGPRSSPPGSPDPSLE